MAARPGSASKRTNLPPTIKELGVRTVLSVHRLCLQAGPSRTRGLMPSSPAGSNLLQNIGDRGEKAGA